MINTTIAHYRITAKLGQGGMGEVYRALDTKLDREVAIKVLPESFAQDKERLARFDREAKSLAALNHPNIAGIHGIEEEGDLHALIMELVEGEDLSQRIKRRALPVEEALEVCKQIAEALEAAHEKGIIHRDLKPANVKLTEDGRVTVLDFGLAKATTSEASNASTTDSVSPTITADYTMPGTLLGTAAYMSPEQARGKPVDKRSDIWSFGCVLYECLTGKRMFKGEDTTETLATIIKGEPDWTILPENTPPTIHLLLRKCLAKDRKRRLHDIADARVDLEQAIADPSSSFIRLSDEALQETRGDTGIQRPVFVSAVLGVALVAVAVTWFLRPAPVLQPTPPPPPIRHMPLDLEFQGLLDTRRGLTAQLSPDGSMLAFIGKADEGARQTQLFIKPLDQLGEPYPLTATEGAVSFCFSPYGQWIVFRKTGTTKLQKVSVSAGGTALPICDSGYSIGVHWTEGDSIVFGTFINSPNGLMRVSSDGGTAESLTTLAKGEFSHRGPQLLPDYNLVLFTAERNGPNFDVMYKRLDDDGHKLLVKDAFQPRYIPDTGHLLFMRENSLFAASFDPLSLKMGEEVPVLNDVATTRGFNEGQFHFCAGDGSLVYLSSSDNPLYQLKWLDRMGNFTSLTNFEPAEIGGFRISPDGNKLAYDLFDGSQWDIWIHDISKGRGIGRLTTNPANDYSPLWSPDGESIVFTSDREGHNNLFWMRADPDGTVHRLTDSPNPQVAHSWHPNSQHISLREGVTGNRNDIRILNLKGDGQSGWGPSETTNFLATPAKEWASSFSPDGRWLAYDSDISGKNQVYVRPFGRNGPREWVSILGQNAGVPFWSGTTNELLFAEKAETNSQERQVYITTYKVGIDGKIALDEPVKWKNGKYDTTARDADNNYTVHPDGEKLLVRKLADVEDDENQSLDKVVLFQNFDEHLRKIAPTGKNLNR